MVKFDWCKLSISVSCAATTLNMDFLLDSCNSPFSSTSFNIQYAL